MTRQTRAVNEVYEEKHNKSKAICNSDDVEEQLFQEKEEVFYLAKNESIEWNEGICLKSQFVLW